jgi:hypothetical protein
MERVLGNDALARARQHNRFEPQVEVSGTAVGTTVTSIEVHLLDRYHGER